MWRYGSVLYSLDVVHPEGQHILVVDGVHDGVRVELVAESLGGGEELRPAGGPGVGRKNGGAGEAKQMVFLEILYDGRVHISELTAVALVKDDDHMLLIKSGP